MLQTTSSIWKSLAGFLCCIVLGVTLAVWLVGFIDPRKSQKYNPLTIRQQHSAHQLSIAVQRIDRFASRFAIRGQFLTTSQTDSSPSPVNIVIEGDYDRTFSWIWLPAEITATSHYQALDGLEALHRLGQRVILQADSQVFRHFSCPPDCELTAHALTRDRIDPNIFIIHRGNRVQDELTGARATFSVIVAMVFGGLLLASVISPAIFLFLAALQLCKFALRRECNLPKTRMVAIATLTIWFSFMIFSYIMWSIGLGITA
jgi:hypothetical protein